MNINWLILIRVKWTHLTIAAKLILQSLSCVHNQQIQ